MGYLKELFIDLFFTGSRLRNKILVMILVVGLTPLVAVSFLSLYTNSLSHKNDLATIEDGVVFQKSNEVQNFIDQIIGSFEVILNLPIQQLVTIENEKVLYNIIPPDNLDNLIKTRLEENPFIQEVSLVDIASGLEIDRLSRSDKEEKIDEENKNIIDLDRLTNLSRLPFFETAANGSKFISPVFYTINGPMIIVASPIKNRDGKNVGIITGQINLGGIQKIVSRTQFGNMGYVNVVDREGRLVASGKENSGLNYTNLSSLEITKDIILGKDHTGIDGQTRYRNFWGEEVVAAGKKLRSLNLALVAEWPADDADGFLNTLRNQVVLFSIITFILILIGSVFLSHRIVHPIQVLQEGTERVAKGDLEQQIEIKTDDEIENLGDSFNSMIKGLKELQALKDEFVFIAAHELRTPVTAIRGYLSMIEEGDAGPISDKMKEYLDPVTQSNMRLVNLVNDLLEVARSEAGRMKVEVKKIEISPLINSVNQEIKPLADEKKINVIYDNKRAVSVLADEARVKEVMINLLSNAIKYTLGTGTIWIWHDIRENKLVTHVKDSGVGIPKEAQAKLFEKFYRVQDERIKNVTGTGLGLFIVKQIVEKMNGQIWFESEDGKGTTFSFSLPIAS